MWQVKLTASTHYTTDQADVEGRRKEETHLVVLNEGVSNVDTSRFQESENHATAKDEFVDLRNRREEFRVEVRIEEDSGELLVLVKKLWGDFRRVLVH